MALSGTQLKERLKSFLPEADRAHVIGKRALAGRLLFTLGLAAAMGANLYLGQASARAAAEGIMGQTQFQPQITDHSERSNLSAAMGASQADLNSPYQVLVFQHSGPHQSEVIRALQVNPAEMDGHQQKEAMQAFLIRVRQQSTQNKKPYQVDLAFSGSTLQQQHKAQRLLNEAAHDAGVTPSLSGPVSISPNDTTVLPRPRPGRRP